MKKLIFLAFFISSCARVRSVTPQDRKEAYETIAGSVVVTCKTYAFDLQSGLSPEVPEMTKLCACR